MKKMLLIVFYWAVITAGIIYAFRSCGNDFPVYGIIGNLNIMFIFAASFVILAFSGLLKDFFIGIQAVFRKSTSEYSRSYRAWKDFYISIVITSILDLVIYFFITSYNLRFVGIAVAFKKADVPINDLILNDISEVLLHGFSSLYVVFLVIVYTLPFWLSLNQNHSL